MPNRFLEGFAAVFSGRTYRHRSSNQGDALARLFYEDLYSLAKSQEFCRRVQSGEWVVNQANLVVGKKGRRGDGTFGEAVPYSDVVKEDGYHIALGTVAQLEIGVEVKIVGKAMGKQRDRVENDLVNQANDFKAKNHTSIAVAFVGINHAETYTSYEGDKSYVAAGRQAPAVEGPKTIDRLTPVIQFKYDECLFLRFKASNVDPYPFSWVDEADTVQRYNTLLLRVIRKYEERFIV